MVVFLQALQILPDLMLKVYLKVCLKDTPVSAYTVHSTGLGLMSFNSVVILSHKIYCNVNLGIQLCIVVALVLWYTKTNQVNNNELQ